MPRTKRAAKPTEPSEPPKPPTCARCGHELDWRDRAYVGAATFCKTCHQRGQRKQRRGFVAFHPAPVVNRSTRRGFGDFAQDRIAAYGERLARQKQAKRTLAARRVARPRAVA